MKDYFLIPWYRYGSSYHLDCPDRVREELLLLITASTPQPVLENTLFHSIEPRLHARRPSCCLRVQSDFSARFTEFPSQTAA